MRPTADLSGAHSSPIDQIENMAESLQPRERAFQLPPESSRSARDRGTRLSRQDHIRFDSRARDHRSRNYADVPLPPPPHENLHETDDDAFDVDPDVPHLQIEGTSEEGSQSSSHSTESGGRNFLGDFVSGLKNLARRNAQRRIDQQAKEIRYPIPTYPSGYERPAWHHLNIEPIDDPEDVEPSELYDSQPATSETAHETYEPYEGDDAYDEETVVNHEIVPGPIRSPVLVEPLPGPNYLKMTSPPLSDASLGVYVNRIQKFFRDLNRLPWVADRVTVDYIPDRRTKHRNAHRPVVSWSSNHASRHLSIDLLSGSSSPSTHDERPINTRPSAATSAPPKSLNTNWMNASVPMPAHVPGTANQHPVYPHGYVPYQPVGQPMARGNFSGRQNVANTQVFPVQVPVPLEAPKAGLAKGPGYLPYRSV